MKLTFKLVSVGMLGILILILANLYVGIHRQVAIFERMAEEKAEMIGDAMEEILLLAWQEGGHDKVLETISEAEEQAHEMDLRWIWLDAPEGDPFCPSVSAAALAATTLEDHKPVWRELPNGEDRVHIYWLVPVDETRPGGLELTESFSELDLRKWNAIYETLLQGAGTLIFTGILAVVMGIRVVGRPLEKLVDKTRRIGRNDLTGPVQFRTRDELAEFADSLNTMCTQLAAAQDRIQHESAARIAAMDQLLHADRLRTVGRLAAGMAHEMGTPLNVISGRAGLIASGKLSGQETVQSATAIKTEAEKMTAIIRQLLDFARQSSPQRARVDLRTIVRQTAELLSAIAAKHDVTLAADCQDMPTPAMVDISQIQQVLTNILVNAIQATPGGGRVEVGIQQRHANPPESHQGPPGQYFSIWVRDNGEGISAEQREHLFEPFYTTKDPGEGTGLGLSIAYRIVEEHGGWIDVTSEPGRGSCFFVYLPMEAAP